MIVVCCQAAAVVGVVVGAVVVVGRVVLLVAFVTFVVDDDVEPVEVGGKVVEDKVDVGDRVEVEVVLAADTAMTPVNGRSLTSDPAALTAT